MTQQRRTHGSHHHPHDVRRPRPAGDGGPPGRAAPVAGLLLAAGAGRRLGGRPKALLEYRGGLLVEHAARVLREGGCDPVHVVLGAAADAVRERATGLGPYRLVDNPEWAEGMGSSLRRGLASLAGSRARAVVVALVDQPGIGPDAVRRVIGEGLGDAPDSALAAAAYDGKRGHPVLFGIEHWPGIVASATGDQGARAYLKAYESSVTLVECADLAAPDDIDTPADLRLLADDLSALRKGGSDHPARSATDR
ncbi:nucleotidyltransferase family protein [Streptomyces sp. PTM05]|uniref:Nucleotidyltransferase family protein n=1 Tax=Streptantibioticus parmotrematis TaxID=2873249 RepID=A0ABS7QRM3_9ACTN|nr:nucleotidyltransferase family protein [Streptantibioticus parmotrematis]MBY8885836.1 nucleotidyltransferase family protein [Streptantibioticus parmotrematis]